MNDGMTTLVRQQQKAPRPRISGWQVRDCGRVIYEHPQKGMVIWWADKNGIDRSKIKPVNNGI